MTGLSFAEANKWRVDAYYRLNLGWDILSPTNMPYEGQYDGPDGKITASTQVTEDQLPSHLTPSGIVTMDEFLIDKSDFVLANFMGSAKVSIGTIWELGYAWAKGKKIVSVLPPENTHDHPFVRRRSHLVVHTLEDAFRYFEAIKLQ
jgi:nucleoside 2-deoxyribosyltransferase